MEARETIIWCKCPRTKQECTTPFNCEINSGCRLELTELPDSIPSEKEYKEADHVLTYGE